MSAACSGLLVASAHCWHTSSGVSSRRGEPVCDVFCCHCGRIGQATMPARDEASVHGPWIAQPPGQVVAPSRVVAL
jgi:hypothetical protein